MCTRHSVYKKCIKIVYTFRFTEVLTFTIVVDIHNLSGKFCKCVVIDGKRNCENTEDYKIIFDMCFEYCRGVNESNQNEDICLGNCQQASLNNCSSKYSKCDDVQVNCDKKNANSVNFSFVCCKKLTVLQEQQNEMIEKLWGIMTNTSKEKQPNSEQNIREKLLRKTRKKKINDIKLDKICLVLSYVYIFVRNIVAGQHCGKSDTVNENSCEAVMCNHFEVQDIFDYVKILKCDADFSDSSHRDLLLHNGSKHETDCYDGSIRDILLHDGSKFGTDCNDSIRDLLLHDGSKCRTDCNDGSIKDLLLHDGSKFGTDCNDDSTKDLLLHDGSKFEINCNAGSDRDLSPPYGSVIRFTKLEDSSIHDFCLQNLKHVNFTSLLKKGFIRPLDLGLCPRTFFNDHLFWQEITVYPVNKQDSETNTSQGDLHNFMHYEVFRVCSFSYTRFPANFDVWVTQLAHAGFYCVDRNGRIICFDCGQEFQGGVNAPIENAHRPGCNHSQHSTPLHMWTQGLNREVLAIYYNRYGSLRPHNFEASGHSLEASGGSEFTMLESHNEQNNEYASVGPSLGRESDVPAGELPDGEESAFRDEIRPQYHSEFVVLPVINETSRDYPFGSQRHSLPSNLNVVSGVVVREESQDLSGSHNVLTSAARNPVPVHTIASRGDHSQDAQSGNENGAVGGADPALDLSKASYPLFSSATARRQTFTTWNPNHSHRPDDLVAAGFFYAGYADCVRCFYCGLGLKFWRETDIPAYQHARYRPHCVYNRLFRGQDYIDRVQQDIQAEQGASAQATNQAPQPPATVQDEAPATPVPNLAETEISSVIRVTPGTEVPQIHVLMDSPVAQTALLNGWQRYQVQRAVEHIVREFGESCLEIGILIDVLMNLFVENPENNLPSTNSTDSNDSGITESALAPNCLASVRVPVAENSHTVDAGLGEEVADSAQPNNQATASAQQPGPAIQQSASSRVELADIIQSVEREHTLLSERMTCRVCQIRPVTCIFLPCGHVIACQECTDRATHCVFCGRQIIGTANVFLA